jgi:DNA polymerase-3 subunit gamma/tau
MLGSVDRPHVVQLIEALAGADGKTVVETVERLRVNGLNPASVLEEMVAVLQHMAVHQAVPSAPDDTDPDAQDTSRLAALMPADETQLLYSICLHGGSELGLAPDEYAALTMVLLRLLAFKPATQRAPAAEKKTLNDGVAAAAAAAPVSVAAAAAASFASASVPSPAAAASAPPATVAPTARSAPAPVTHAPQPAAEAATPQQPQPAAPAGRRLSVVQGGQARAAGAGPDLAPASDTAAPADQVVAVPVRLQADARNDAVRPDQPPPVLVPTEEGDFWFATVQQLVASQAVTALARELALQSQLVGRDTDQWILKVERESLQQLGSRDRLAAALQAAGHAVTLLVEVGRVTDSPARRLAAAAAERQLAAEKLIFDDPFVQTMMREFGAKIVAGSIRPL